jgi:hypothetical protein
MWSTSRTVSFKVEVGREPSPVWLADGSSAPLLDVKRRSGRSAGDVKCGPEGIRGKLIATRGRRGDDRAPTRLADPD